MTAHSEADLRLRLKGLQQDIPPRVDLWPGLAAQLQVRSTGATTRPRFGRRWFPVATAASLLLAIGFTWMLGIRDRPAPLILSEALAMSEHYEAALAEYAQAPMRPELQPAMQDLDQSASTILAAIQRHPEARFLLGQLRRTYDRRLELTRRAIIPT